MLDIRAALVRLQARAGVRLALAQTIIVIVSFALAGYLTQVALARIGQASIRAQVLGEAKSLDDEFIKKGAAHLPFTVAKRSRLWRGFDYRLESPTGARLAGRLPAVGGHLGWDDLAVDLPGAPHHHFLTFTKTMPDKSRLTVGQDKIVEAGEMAAIRWTLLICGALGVLFCVAASYFFARGTWRRIAAVGAAAQAVSAGDLDVRVKTHAGAPRDDVDELSETFNAMLDRIGALVAQVSQVSTDIAHDLRTPLTRFGQKLERLKTKAQDDPEILHAVTALEGDISEILRTFDALLQLSTIEVGDAPTAGLVDLGDIAARVAEAYRPDIENSGRDLTVEIDAAPIHGDGDLIAQALSNLLENALRHTPVGAHILLAVRRNREGATLIMQDDGPGIPAEQLETVIKPFVRLEQSRHTPGSGLGLAIVAAVASRHAACFSLEDASPGLRVTLAFPKRATPGAPAFPVSAARKSGGRDVDQTRIKTLSSRFVDVED